MKAILLIPIKIKKKESISLFLFKIIIFLRIIKITIMTDCDNKDKPFLNNGICQSSCTAQEINDKICTIKNEIIKKQWLNNIIDVGGPGCAFINIATTESNNLFYIATAWPESNERTLYLLNYEGYGFLDRDNPKSIIEIDDNGKGRFESETFTIKLYESSDNKEFFVSISKARQNIEIYDFYTGNYYFDVVEVVFGNLINTFASISVHLKLNLYSQQNKNMYLIGLLACEYLSDGTEDPHFYLFRTKFTSLNIKTNRPEFSKTTSIIIII